ncbi:MAG: hypothetical protein V4642_00845 [Bacteroidota bacterium]
MKKQRRNIQAIIRVGGIEFLFGLVFLLLPLAFKMNEQIENENTGSIQCYSSQICESDLLEHSIEGKKILFEAPYAFNNKSSGLLVLRLDSTNSVSWYYNTVLIKKYSPKQLELLKTDFRNFCSKLDTNLRFQTAFAPSASCNYQYFISVLEILKEYPKTAFGQPEISYAF